MRLTTKRGLARTTTPGRRRSARAAALQVGFATAACGLWVALALPGMNLVPGTGGGATADVSISLQSALLGIDDGDPRVTVSELRALHALGLDPRNRLSASLLHAHGGVLSGS